MKTALKVILATAALAVAGAAGVYHYMSGGAVAAPGAVRIPTGATFETVVDSLNAGGRIRSEKKFRVMSQAMGYGDNVKGGNYALKEGMTYRQLVGMLRNGAQTPVRITFNNMRTLPQLAGRIAQQLEADSLSLLAAMTADSTAAACGLTRATMPVIFIPNTYEIYWTTSPGGFVARMKKEYDRFWNESRMQKLAATGLSREQAATLASIVYEETKMSDEMPRVAGVYINRLKTGMPLQADPTLKFALGDFTLRRILDRDKEVDSPYNTYKRTGLPPGPICMPSIAAVDAVLGYEKHNYLYFCARPDYSGYHNFARTLAEHNANSRRYWEFLNRERIYR